MDVERAKTDLAIKPDFNLIDAFRIFDIDSTGEVPIDVFKDGLYSLGLFVEDY